MNETSKGKLARLSTQVNRDGYDSLCYADMEFLIAYAQQLENENQELQSQLDFVNNEQQKLTHRLSAQSRQVFNGV